MGLTLYDIIKGLLNESVDLNSVNDAIDNKYYVRIKYDDGGDDSKSNPKGSRDIRPDAVGLSKRNNRVLRAFQTNGNSRRGAPNWKYFDLDNIVSWKPLRNHHFYDIPCDDYGTYNLTGDRSMKVIWNKVKYDYDKDDTLSHVRAQRKTNSPKVAMKNVQGPINAANQRKKNVYTSFPNSERYKKMAKEVDKASSKEEMKKKWADFEKAEQEAEMQNQSAQPQQSTSGPIYQQNNNYDSDEYDVDETDWNVDETDWNDDETDWDDEYDYFKDKNKNKFKKK